MAMLRTDEFLRKRSIGGAVKAYVQLARPSTLVVPFIGIIVGAALARAHEAFGALRAFRPDSLLQELPLRVAAAACAAALINAASNALNQVCDIDIDRVSKPLRPLPSGDIANAGALTFAVLVYLLGMGLAVYAASGNLPTIIIFLAAALLTVLYSVPPFRVKRFPWIANVCIALPRGWLLLAAGWSVARPGFDPLLQPEPWLLAAAPGLFLIGAASTKDFSDVDGDRIGQIQTLPVKYGARKATRLIAPFLSLPFLVLPVAVVLADKGLAPDALTGDRLLLALLGITLAFWGMGVSADLTGNPGALAARENHPAWRHMYGMMLFYYLGLAGCYAVAAMGP